MAALDHLNRCLRPDAVKLGALALNPTWTPRAEHVSQRYTTHWQELATVTPWRSPETPVTPQPLGQIIDISPSGHPPCHPPPWTLSPIPPRS